MVNNEAYIGVPARFGMHISGTFAPIHQDLNSVFRKHVFLKRSKDIDLIIVGLQIDGDEGICSWEETGLKRLRLYKKRRLIDITACFELREHKGRALREVRQLVLNRVKEAISACIAKIKKEKLDLDEEGLNQDLTDAFTELEAMWGLLP